MKNGQTGAAGQIRSIVATVLGVMLAAVPLALWVAWSQDVFWGVLAAGGVCAALWVLLAEIQVPPVEDRSHSDAVGMRAELPDEFFSEIHQIFPLTYHHSRVGKQRFRRAMERLRTLMARRGFESKTRSVAPARDG